MEAAQPALVAHGWDNTAATTAAPVRRPVAASQAAYRPLGTFRFALAVMVTGHHYAIHLAPTYGKDLVQSLELGRMAVLLFFVLSGFVICEAAVTFYRERPAAFLANRALRILPPFLAVLVLSYVVEGILLAGGLLHPLEGGVVTSADLGAASVLRNLVSILPGSELGGLRPQRELNPYIWAIRVEGLFYLLVFAGTGAAFWARRRRLPEAAGRLGAWLGAIGLALSACSVAAGVTGRGAGAMAFAPYFALGGAWFFVLAGRRENRSTALVATAASLLAAAAHYALAGTAGWFAVRASLLLALILVAAWLSSQRVGSRSMVRVDRALGALCYPIYLLQFLGGTLVLSLWPQGGEVGHVLAAFAMTALLAVLLDRILEPVLTGVRARLRRAPAPGSVAGDTAAG